ncbi:MAG: cob(I)yrinic acid a,c-diamide adenosyltransferase [Halobacteriales archaeon]|nr:cob(I)yrinic acid a,c-diamide adenosyltransferase [Halobacteriales archaeon]
MKIYTRRGDDGRTDLRSGERVSKASRRIEAYGNVDEANARVGRAVTVLDEDHEDMHETLAEAQNVLFKAQADLANTDKEEDDPRVTEDDVESVEEAIDEYEEELEPLESFVLPGGTPAGAALHEARTVVRRAERRVVALDEEEGDTGEVQDYLNRLSDLLFVMARVANARAGVEEESPTY